MKPPSLPILQGIYPYRPKDSGIHFDTLAPSAKIIIEKGEKTFSQEFEETLQKKKGKSTKEANAEEEEGRERKQTKKKNRRYSY